MSDCVLEGVRGVEATWDREGGGVLARLASVGVWLVSVGAWLVCSSLPTEVWPAMTARLWV